MDDRIITIKRAAEIATDAGVRTGYNKDQPLEGRNLSSIIRIQDKWPLHLRSINGVWADDVGGKVTLVGVTRSQLDNWISKVLDPAPIKY